MKRIKVLLILILLLSFFNVYALEYEPKEGQILVGNDLYDGYVNPNQIISSSINYYIDTNDQQSFKIYQYQGLNNWLVYKDSERKFVSMSETNISDLELNRYINYVRSYIKKFSANNLENKASFTYNDKYYFLVSDLKKQGINPYLNISGYVIYTDDIIGYDITLNGQSYINIKESDVINVKDFGALGDGNTDDTSSIQSAVKKLNEEGGVLYFPNGKYIMEVKIGWQQKQHDESLIKINTDKKVIIDFDESTIKLRDGRRDANGNLINDNLLSHYNVIKVENSKDVTIQNGKLVGDRIEHCYYKKGVNNKEDCIYKTDIPYYPTHEFGFGINIYSKTSDIKDKKVIIDKMDISDMTGDSIIIDDSSNTSEVTIKNSELYKSRRQGISILEVDKVLVENTNIYDIGHGDGVNGTAPMAGIDIEPNEVTIKTESGYEKTCDGVKVNNVIFNNLNISNTLGFGIIISGCSSSGLGNMSINNSYIEGLSGGNSNVFIKNSEINNKISNLKDNSGNYYGKKYIGASANFENCNINIYNNKKIFSGASGTFGISNGTIDNCTIKVHDAKNVLETNSAYAFRFDHTKMTNTYLYGGSFNININRRYDENGVEVGSNNMVLKEGSGNNTYDNFYIVLNSDDFNDENSIIKNSYFGVAVPDTDPEDSLTFGKSNINNTSFENTRIVSRGNNQLLIFNNSAFDKVDLSQFNESSEYSLLEEDGSLKKGNKICTFNYSTSGVRNKCVDN